MKKIVVLILLIAGWQTIQAQNVSQFKILL